MSKTDSCLFFLVRKALGIAGADADECCGTTVAVGTCCNDSDTVSALPAQCCSEDGNGSHQPDSSPQDRRAGCSCD